MEKSFHFYKVNFYNRRVHWKDKEQMNTKKNLSNANERPRSILTQSDG